MVAKKNGKGKPGVGGKGINKVETPEVVGEELGDPGQGGSGARAEDREVQEELDTAVLENEALKRELRAAKEVLEKRSEKEELRAKRAELEKRMARVRQREDEWALR